MEFDGFSGIRVAVQLSMVRRSKPPPTGEVARLCRDGEGIKKPSNYHSGIVSGCIPSQSKIKDF